VAQAYSSYFERDGVDVGFNFNLRASSSYFERGGVDVGCNFNLHGILVNLWTMVAASCYNFINGPQPINH
jgi:hypothetical protein